jgi:hypothetical protein
MFNGMILFETDEIVVIATYSSSNRKTGDMVQIWILSKNVDPVTLVKTDGDSVICMDCKHRLNRSCYVNVGQAPLSIYKAYKSGKYEPLNYDVLKSHLRWKAVRFGAYGEPVLIPIELVQFIAKNSQGWTGYTHQWDESKYSEYKPYFMASVDTPDEYNEANKNGWRTFRVGSDSQTLEHEIVCHNTTANKPCRDCLLCDGYGLNNSHKPMRNIAVTVHGTKAKIKAFNSIQIATV